MKELELVMTFIAYMGFGVITTYFGDYSMTGALVTLAICAIVGTAVWYIADRLAR